MPGLFAELYRSSLCHMVKKLQVFMSGANLGTHTLFKGYNKGYHENWDEGNPI